jgi:hypothetical protein
MAYFMYRIVNNLHKGDNKYNNNNNNAYNHVAPNFSLGRATTVVPFCAFVAYYSGK